MNPSIRRSLALGVLALAGAVNPQPAVFPRPPVPTPRIASTIWHPVNPGWR